jgi:hypothetical protein
LLNSIGTGVAENIGTTLLTAIAPPLGLAAKLGLAGYNLYNKLNPATQANTPLIASGDLPGAVPDDVAVDNAVQLASSIQSPSDTMAAISAAAPSLLLGQSQMHEPYNSGMSEVGDAGPLLTGATPVGDDVDNEFTAASQDGGGGNYLTDQMARGGRVRARRRRNR